MADYSLVRDANDEVCGLWLRDTAQANDQFLICALLMQEGVSPPDTYRVVANTYDGAGGCFVMFGSNRAPGE